MTGLQRFARGNRGQAYWLVSNALNLPPSEVIDRASLGDIEVLFSLAAAQRQYELENDRWRALFKMLKGLGKRLG